MDVRKLFVTGSLIMGVMILLLVIFPVPFIAIAPHLIRTKMTFLITESAGKYGTLLGIVIACFLYTLQETGLKNKLFVFAKAIAGLLVVIGSFAAINEKFTKPLLKRERPSHHEMLSRLEMNPLLDSLYNLSKEERVVFFGREVQLNKSRFINIDTDVLNHWIEEGGYSFPSGHTFNAFLLAMIFAFGIAGNSAAPALQKLWPLPLFWAALVGLSRVALGAHTIYDVSAGALLGVCVGTLLLHLDITRHWITHVKQNN